jgi:hypothetical protein
MKLTQLLFICSGIFSLNFVAVSPLLAQCVQADVGVQVDVSRGKANQTHNRDAQQEGPCTGNTSVTSGAQVNVRGDGVNQHREVKQRMTGGSGNPSGVNGPTVQPSVNVQFDLDNSADGYNPNIPPKPSRR